MAMDRFSFTMERAVGTAVREAAARAGVSISAWLVAAAEDRLRNQLLGDALEAWEQADGAFTADELVEAARVLDGREAADAGRA